MSPTNVHDKAVSALTDTLANPVGSGTLPSAVGLVATRDGLAFESAHGYRDMESAAPMTLDTVCWIGSCSKAITAIACMQLVEQSRLVLDQPVYELLPELADPQVLVAVEGGVPVLRPAARPITLRHLMTHTAGFTYSGWNGLMTEYEDATGTPFIQECRTQSLMVPLVFDPGDRWEYGISMDWVGQAIERASGVSLETYMRENILDPLGMSDTGFVRNPRHREKQATVYFREANGGLVPFPWAIPDDADFFMAGGGMFSTPRDFVRILRLLLGGGSLDGTRTLRPDTVRTMMTNQIGDLDVCGLELPEGSDGGRADGFDGPLTGSYNPFPAQAHKWTLSFDMNLEPVDGGRAAGSISWCAAQNIYYWIDPSSGISGLFVTQLLPFPDEHAVSAAKALERAAYQFFGTGRALSDVSL